MFLGFEVFHIHCGFFFFFFVFCYFFLLFPNHTYCAKMGLKFSLSPFSTYKHKDAVVRGLLTNILPCRCGYSWHLAFGWKGRVSGVDRGGELSCEGFPTSRSSLLGVLPAPPFV